jgi:copper(I)-binding protein
VGAAAAMAAGVLAATGCGSSASGRAADVVARVGSIEIVHPFLPEPASPSVAAIYLTVDNTGSTPDELVSVSTKASTSSMLMTEDEHGSAGTMAPVADLSIPAHGQASLAPGHDHVMLANPRGPLRVGQKIEIVLRFKRAGPVTVSVPVVPLTAIVNDDDAPTTAMGNMGSMGHMKGMS